MNVAELKHEQSFQQHACLSLAADTAELAKLGSFIQHHCKVENAILIELAVIEVVVNAIEHGQATTISIDLFEHHDYYRMFIKDNGCAFNPLMPDALPMGELREGGYGLGIIQTMSSQSDYKFQEGFNQLDLQFEKK